MFALVWTWRILLVGGLGRCCAVGLPLLFSMLFTASLKLLVVVSFLFGVGGAGVGGDGWVGSRVVVFVGLAVVRQGGGY